MRHLLSVVALAEVVLCAVHQIGTVSEFIEFASSVNSGNKYEGTTVLLVNDMPFSGRAITPIGTTSYQFRGTFD